MKTTLILDDDLLERAHEITGTKKRADLVNEALRALIEREAARYLANLAGSMPELADIPRRRPK
ncbi:MAG: type II toxin-antitoxin system VapB family antitoxin [Pseudomonadota bacterium]